MGFQELPIRTTPIPETTRGVPHVQLGVQTNPAMNTALLAQVAAIPDLEIRDSTPLGKA